MSDPRIILDAHQDIAYNMLYFRNDFTQSAYAKRRQLHNTVYESRGLTTTGLPETLLGRIGIIFSTLFVAPISAVKRPELGYPGYRDEKEAFRQAMAQCDVYYRLTDTDPRIRLIRTQNELATVLDSWREGVPMEEHKVGLVLTMESADSIREPQAFEEWYEKGVRSVGPAWKGTRYCGGTGQPGGLTALGRQLLEVMSSFNVSLDLSHMAEKAYFEALDLYTGSTIIASHSNPRSFYNTDRHLSDKMISALAERDGVIGVVPYNQFLIQDWSPSDRKDRVPLTTLISAIDHICQITGSARHVGIGSDFDGDFGAQEIPADMDTVADLLKIEKALQERGYSAEDIHGILCGNFLRKLRAVLPK